MPRSNKERQSWWHRLSGLCCSEISGEASAPRDNAAQTFRSSNMRHSQTGPFSHAHHGRCLQERSIAADAGIGLCLYPTPRLGCRAADEHTHGPEKRATGHHGVGHPARPAAPMPPRHKCRIAAAVPAFHHRPASSRRNTRPFPFNKVKW